MDAKMELLSEPLSSKMGTTDELLETQHLNSIETRKALGANFSRLEEKLNSLQDYVKAGNRELKRNLIRQESQLESLEDLFKETKRELKTSSCHRKGRLESTQDCSKKLEKKLEEHLSCHDESHCPQEEKGGTLLDVSNKIKIELEGNLARQEEKLESLETLIKSTAQQMMLLLTNVTSQQTAIESELRKLSAEQKINRNDLLRLEGRLSECSSRQTEMAAGVETVTERDLVSSGISLSKSDTDECEERKRFIKAVEKADEAAVQAWIRDGKDLEVAKLDGTGMTALHIATKSGLGKMVRMLLKAGADVNARAKDESTNSLLFAVRKNQMAVEDQLRKDGANLVAKSDDKWTPLHMAVSTGRGEIATQLILHGADPNVRSSYGWTPLHFAVWTGDTVAVDQLIRYGADPNMESTSGWTPLHLAVWKGHKLVINRLANFGGANPNKRLSNGWTALHVAASMGVTDVAKALVLAGADRLVKDEHGETPRDVALRFGFKTVTKLLLTTDLK